MTNFPQLAPFSINFLGYDAAFSGKILPILPQKSVNFY
jgi:hypothetical protein